MIFVNVSECDANTHCKHRNENAPMTLAQNAPITGRDSASLCCPKNTWGQEHEANSLPGNDNFSNVQKQIVGLREEALVDKSVDDKKTFQ